MPTKSLTREALGRATLARQSLLAPSTSTPLAVIEQLAGMQAQVPRPPFLGLWTRLAKFTRDDLHRLVVEKSVVRATMMRGTIHLMSARDFLAWRPVMQPMLVQQGGAILGDRIAGLDLAKLAAAARPQLPTTFTELRAALVKRFPKYDERALGFTVRMHLPLVMVPAETAWSWSGNAPFDDAAQYLDTPIPTVADVDALVLRYLAAFGPATVKDAQAWSALKDLAPVFARLRERLVTFVGPDGRELFDLPDAPRPAADTPAPIRFLPEYDNLVLAYADRSRFLDEPLRKRLTSKNGIVSATVFVDGRAVGTWKLDRVKAKAKVLVTSESKLTKAMKAAIGGEAERAAKFLESDATAIEVGFA